MAAERPLIQDEQTCSRTQCHAGDLVVVAAPGNDHCAGQPYDRRVIADVELDLGMRWISVRPGKEQRGGHAADDESGSGTHVQAQVIATDGSRRRRGDRDPRSVPSLKFSSGSAARCQRGVWAAASVAGPNADR